jgi:hypothetical protein
MNPVRQAIPRITAAAVICAAVLAPSAVLAAIGPTSTPGSPAASLTIGTVTARAGSPADGAAATARPEFPAKPGLTADPGEQLLSVTGSSASNAWAVGETVTTPSRSVVLHWNGRAWSKVTIPDPSVNSVVGASAVSAGNAWLVGNQCPDQCTKPETTLILHWNGAAWSHVASPNPAGKVNFLSAVSASSSADAWAVGSTCTISTGSCVPLLLHWNGKAWARAASPAPGGSESLEAVATISPGDAWAVGRACDPVCYQPLVMHWNGTKWSTSAVPSVGSGSSGLSGVAATSASDVWAVGRADDDAKTVILHWNGMKWSRPPSPDPGPENVLNGVTVTSPGNAWAVGGWCTTAACAVSHTLIAHWNGAAWSQVKSPSPGPGSALADVAATSSSNAWAVGANCTDLGSQCEPIMLHWNGKAWSEA